MNKMERYRAPALDKGLDILELLSEYSGGLTRAEIVTALNRSVSEIYRMLERLVVRQYVLKSPSGDLYSLSLKMYALALKYPPIHRLTHYALPVMDAFTRKAEQSCHLSVYDRGNLLVIAQVDSPTNWCLSIRHGARVSLMDTSSGHVLLAFENEERRLQMIEEHEQLDGERPVAPAQLDPILQSIRKQGYKQSESMQSFGVTDISCPIFTSDKLVIGVMTVPYIRRIDSHLCPSLDEVRDILLESVKTFSLDH